MIALLKTLDDECQLSSYLRDVVFKKLTTEGEDVTFEQVLLLRLTCDVANAT